MQSNIDLQASVAAALVSKSSGDDDDHHDEWKELDDRCLTQQTLQT